MEYTSYFANLFYIPKNAINRGYDTTGQKFSTYKASVIFYEDRLMDINDRIPTTEVVSAIKILNKCYTLYKPWPGHDSHFHTSFIEWLECPQTCVEEVQEFFSKI